MTRDETIVNLLRVAGNPEAAKVAGACIESTPHENLKKYMDDERVQEFFARIEKAEAHRLFLIRLLALKNRPVR